MPAEGAESVRLWVYPLLLPLQCVLQLNVQGVVGKSDTSAVVKEEGRCSLGQKQHSPNTTSVPTPPESSNNMSRNG